MMRLNVVLLLVVLASALGLVHLQYQSRRLFADNEKALAEARRLNTERERLSVEQRAHATPLRVEKLAKEQLSMRSASPANTQYLKAAVPASAQPASSSAATHAGAQWAALGGGQ